jgi:hypothetical protein
MDGHDLIDGTEEIENQSVEFVSSLLLTSRDELTQCFASIVPYSATLLSIG